MTRDKNDITFDEVIRIKRFVEVLPDCFRFSYRGKDGKEQSFNDFFWEKSEDFFNTTQEDLKAIEGKCFANRDNTIILKVYEVPEEDGDRFLYEEFGFDGYSWYPEDFIWLQETADYDESYKKYCTTEYMNMNINRENMYMLGKDGNLYVDMTCGGDYMVFKPCRESKFVAIREEAIANEKE